MNRVIILRDFRTSGRDFKQGEVYWLHGSRDPYSIDVTNEKREFAVSIPKKGPDGQPLFEIASTGRVKTILRVQAGEFPKLSTFY